MTDNIVADKMRPATKVLGLCIPNEIRSSKRIVMPQTIVSLYSFWYILELYICSNYNTDPKRRAKNERFGILYERLSVIEIQPYAEQQNHCS